MSDGEGRSGHWDSPGTKASGAWVQRRRLATAMREVIERLVTSGAPEDELREAAVALERYAEHLETHPRLLRREGFGETSPAGDVAEFFDMSPLIGLSNPLSPPVELWIDENRAFGRVRFGSAYEGPPGHVHGGFIAAAFDEVLGYAHIDVHTVRTHPAALMVVLGPEGDVRSVRILAFHEPLDYLPSEKWYAQFAGKTAQDRLRVGSDVHGVVNATLSTRVATDGIRRALAYHTVLIGSGD